ncbi:hypothetical protein [Phyllobacterium sp. 22229]|uniref:hypothetical protein n=1 Tax=Phyllobacterium sp. 22229 TaxID=3453895 RepID=UPI003F850EC7
MNSNDDVIYTHPVNVMVDGEHQIVTVALFQNTYALVLDEIKRDNLLWLSFKTHIDSIREMDRRQIDGPAAYLSTDHFNAIVQCLEKHIKYGGALLSPFFDHARKAGLD